MFEGVAIGGSSVDLSDHGRTRPTVFLRHHFRVEVALGVEVRNRFVSERVRRDAPGDPRAITGGAQHLPDCVRRKRSARSLATEMNDDLLMIDQMLFEQLDQKAESDRIEEILERATIV